MSAPSASSGDDRPPPAHPWWAARWLAWALLGLGAIRLFGLVWHEPLAGYANQYDMVRVSACLGLWPDRPQALRAEAHPTAPFAHYVRGAIDSEACVPSTSVALAGIAAAIDRAAHWFGPGADAGMDLREFGTLQALALLAATLWLQRRLRRHPGWRLGHAAWFALVLTDPFNTLWLNTFYTEPGALLGAYLSCAALLCMALEPQPRRDVNLIFLSGLLLLGASRVQHLLLPPCLALLAWLVQRRARNAGLAVPLAALALSAATFAMQSGIQSQHPTLAAVNRSDSLFGALLPASADPAALVRRLGLPPECVELSHTTWFLKRQRSPQAECPQAYALSHARLLAAVAAEPRTVAVALGRGLVLATAWRVPYLGELADAERARIEPGPGGIWRSLADPISRLGLRATCLLWLVPFAAGLFAGARLLLPSRGQETGTQLAVDALLAASAAAIGVGWLGAVLGDGYSEVARHLHLGQNFALLGWMVLLGDWIAVIGSRRPEANPQPWSNLWPGVAAVIVTGAAVLIIRTLPLGFGVIEVPAGDRVMEGGLRLAGRALDAEGIDRIEAVTANGARTELTLSDSPAIALIFPVAAASAGHEFRGELAIEDLSARAPLRLDVVVTNSAGVQTVIDQRWLRPAPTPIPSP